MGMRPGAGEGKRVLETEMRGPGAKDWVKMEQKKSASASASERVP